MTESSLDVLAHTWSPAWVDNKSVTFSLQGIAQASLADVAARSYLSEVERGIKNPTVEKLDELARAIEVHPLTILTMAYLPQLKEQDLEVLQRRVAKEVRTILAKSNETLPKKAR